jgi:hypothetical protein
MATRGVVVRVNRATDRLPNCAGCLRAELRIG